MGFVVCDVDFNLVMDAGSSNAPALHLSVGRPWPFCVYGGTNDEGKRKRKW